MQSSNIVSQLRQDLEQNSMAINEHQKQIDTITTNIVPDLQGLNKYIEGVIQSQAGEEQPSENAGDHTIEGAIIAVLKKFPSNPMNCRQIVHSIEAAGLKMGQRQVMTTAGLAKSVSATLNKSKKVRRVSRGLFRLA